MDPNEDQTQWLTMDEAVAFLGKSDSTIERLTKARLIRSKLVPRPGRTLQRLFSTENLALRKAVATPKLIDVRTATGAQRFLFGLFEVDVLLILPQY